MCDQYLYFYHKSDILEILEHPEVDKSFSINVKFIELYDNDPSLGKRLIKEPEKSFEEWDGAIQKVQTRLVLERDCKFTVKTRVTCRIYGLPSSPSLKLHRNTFPRSCDTNKILEISGTVMRVTLQKVLEFQRTFICTKCKYIEIVKATYERKYLIEAPFNCSNPEGCTGSNIVSLSELEAECCKDYQEIKIQETVTTLDMGCLPNFMWVTLEDDLVDMVKPGDNITVCGIVKQRLTNFIPGKKFKLELVLNARHVDIHNINTSVTLTPQMTDMFGALWKTYGDRPLVARDIILKSICPEIYGLHMVKLAIAVVLAGGSQSEDKDEVTKVRTEPHLLLVGDPGTGKSELLRFAAKIAPRSVFTTGVGSTAAGLTVSAVMEDGEWQLEPGALVLADGGICCIDEFSSMRSNDRTSIHEAMEQQTISVAKAGIVRQLKTKCSVIAATNARGRLDPRLPLHLNVQLEAPLLSRFDLVLLLPDKFDLVRDKLLADFISKTQFGPQSCELSKNLHWTVETLQTYFYVVRKLNPILTEDSNKVLAKYYQYQRRYNLKNKSRTTVRLLDSLVRLSQGHARLMHHEEVRVEDAIMAVVLTELSMQPEFTTFDVNFDVQDDFPQDPEAKYKEILEVILKQLNLEELLEQELAKKRSDTSRKQQKQNESFISRPGPSNAPDLDDSNQSVKRQRKSNFCGRVEHDKDKENERESQTKDPEEPKDPSFTSMFKSKNFVTSTQTNSVDGANKSKELGKGILRFRLIKGDNNKPAETATKISPDKPKEPGSNFYDADVDFDLD